MKKIILTIRLLFSRVSFGSDALDGKSIICTEENWGTMHGWRFVGHDVLQDVFLTRNDKVLIREHEGMTGQKAANDITSYYVYFWSKSSSTID